MSLPSCQQHWRNIRLRTKLCFGGSRRQNHRFDYSTSGTDDGLFGAMLPIPTYPQDLDQPTLPPDSAVESIPQDPMSDVSFNDCLPQFFSDHEIARSPSPQLSPSHNPPEQSLVGTSAPLRTHPSLTDYLSNYPIWPIQAEDSNMSFFQTGETSKENMGLSSTESPATEARDVTSAPTEKQAEGSSSAVSAKAKTTA